MATSDVDSPLFEAAGVNVPSKGYGCVVVRKRGEREYFAQYSGSSGTSIQLTLKVDVSSWKKPTVQDLTKEAAVAHELKPNIYLTWKAEEGHEYLIQDT